VSLQGSRTTPALLSAAQRVSCLHGSCGHSRWLSSMPGLAHVAASLCWGRDLVPQPLPSAQPTWGLLGLKRSENWMSPKGITVVAMGRSGLAASDPLSPPSASRSCCCWLRACSAAAGSSSAESDHNDTCVRVYGNARA
jgi:hypothetical protein